MTFATKLIHQGRRYLVSWNGTTKRAMKVEIWSDAKGGFWRSVWVTPRPAGRVIVAVIAAADAIERKAS